MRTSTKALHVGGARLSDRAAEGSGQTVVDRRDVGARVALDTPLAPALTAPRHREVLLVLLVAVAVRIPFWAEALRTPIDGDEALIGLMARHLGHGTTIWGQPFGSPLEPTLASPFVAALGPTVAALRLPYFALGILLVLVTYHLAAAVHPRAALPAALLMACPAPYLLIVASLPPTTYPSTLVLCGLLLLLTLRLGERLRAGAPAHIWLAVWGSLAGLAMWTHLMSASVVVATWVYLLLRTRRRALVLTIPAVMMLTLTAPWWSGGLGQALRIVRLSGPGKPLVPHLAKSLPNLIEASGGLLGVQTPLIADDARHVLTAPFWIATILLLAYALVVWRAARRARGAPATALLLAVIALVLVAFPFPQRSGPHTIRHLTLAYVPLVVLAGFAAQSFRRMAVAWAVVLTIAGLNLAGSVRLLSAWRSTDRAAMPFLLPDLAPVLEALDARGIRRAYASYGPAYRLSYESGEHIVASPPWNERFRHYPLPYLDEVRFAKGVAWILTPDVPPDLPTPAVFEAALRAIGGSWSRTDVGPAVIYHDFVPPVSPSVVALSTAGNSDNGDASSGTSPDVGRAITFALPTPRRLDGVTFLAPSEGPSLLRSMDVEVSADGQRFENVLSRRRREERDHPVWVNGHPQYVTDHDSILIPLNGRLVAALRITPVDSEDAWAVGKLLLHPPTREEPQGWSEWLDSDLSWDERGRSLADNPLEYRADWHYRVIVSERALRSLGAGPG